MRKFYLTLLALVLPFYWLQARPVSEQTARNLAQSFVAASFEFTRQSTDLILVKTGVSERGEACYYIYNVGETGFVIMAGDDCVRPIIGYSENGVFNPDDMAPALADFLETKCQYIMDKAQKGMQTFEVANDWTMLEKTGRMVSRHGGREDEYLVMTQWNQNYPYNYFCPEGEGGPGGHCYAGCVATAAAQLMKFWNHPIQGQGSHTYTPEDHPEYGPLTVNFGEATYDWDNMPNSISANSPQEQIEAVAELIYHVGVSVDMNYRPTSSGAVTGKLCETMPAYFFYTDQMDNLYRENYTHEGYMDLLIRSVDMGWPMVHRGGGHAYVVDGYNDYDMVHINWGWSGSSDDWFNIDDHGYTEGESVIYNYVPAERYAATSAAPTDIQVEPMQDGTLAATITWKNPTKTLTNVDLTAIDQIVVARGSQVVYTEDNVTPGEEMSFTDESIPYYDCYTYAVYAIVNGQRGASAVSDKVLVSPVCDWKIIMQSTAFQGWNGGYVSLYTNSGVEVQRFTITGTVPSTLSFPVPFGHFSLGWTAPNNAVSNMTIIIKDGQNNTVFNYQGNSNGLDEGAFFTANNDCGSGVVMAVPYGLVGEAVEDGVALNWHCDEFPLYGFNIYRDELLYGLVSEGTTFTDTDVTEGHCYTVTALGEGGESEQSNETCASSGDCMAASDLWFEYTGNNYKIKLFWVKPEAEGLSGYYLFRKFGEGGEYERIKLLGSNATSYTDNTANVQGDYYYRLYAYYGATDCTSSPASVKYNPNLFYLHVYYSPTAVDESNMQQVSIFPNPANQSLNIGAEGMTGVRVCNLLGQVVMERVSEGNTLIVSTSDWNEGLYFVTISTENGLVTRRVSIVH